MNFFWFDFHAECKKMHYENLEKLMNLTSDLVKTGEYVPNDAFISRFFAYDLSQKQIQQLQTAVIRTNCIDCLDRMRFLTLSPTGTNVVQSLYAKHMLFSQLFGDDGEMVMTECL